MKTKGGLLAALIFGVLLSGCAATGTKMATKGDSYKSLANSQQWWCSSFGSTCGCTIDGMKTTCSLAQSCLSSGNCTVAQ